MSSPTLSSVNSSSHNTYPSPPTSPMTNYLYNKTSSGRISPPSFSLGHPAAHHGAEYADLRRKSTTGPQYTMTTTTTSTATNKKGGFFW